MTVRARITADDLARLHSPRSPHGTRTTKRHSWDTTNVMTTVPLPHQNKKRSKQQRAALTRPKESLSSFPWIVGTTIFFCLTTLFLAALSSHHQTAVTSRHQRPLSAPTNTVLFSHHNTSRIPLEIVMRLDVILVLGGGVPQSLEEPPIYVQQRCDDAAAIVQQRQQQQQHRLLPSRQGLLPILCLSAGTAHLPQLLAPNGLPVWESVSSAAYLQQKHGLGRNTDGALPQVLVETTSYDTIGNAFYARTSFTDIIGWRRILVITNEVSE